MQHTDDDTSRALLEAAHRLLSEHGAEALTVRRIATGAGMSTMNVYSRFGGKDGVIDVLYIDGFERLFAVVDAVPSSDHTAHDLMEVAQAYRQFALDNPTYYRIMFRSAIHDFTPSEAASSMTVEGLERFVERVRVGQERGDIVNHGGFEPLEIGTWLWATCHGLVSLELEQVGRDRFSWATVFEHGMWTAICGLHPSVWRARV
ncbi:MAG: TetR/AcrR family transcriptional regulator [Ilumatobacter sp.]|nr:TetR/AcrR family transcriptional regulator [Ilumatobacter sp.]